MRFRLIDRIIEQTPERLVGVKAVSSGEEYLADHFPGFPVLPGVMMLEAITQAGRLLLAGRDGGARDEPIPWEAADRARLILAEVRNVRYSNMVRPGEALRVEVTVRKNDASGTTLDGVGRVDDDVVVQGRIRLASLPEPNGVIKHGQ